MSSPQLYEKITTKKGRTTYRPYVEPEGKVLEFTDAQCVTLAGALGVTLLSTSERNMPPHKKVARKGKALEHAVLDLFQGTGAELDIDMADLVCRTWDKTMKELSA